MTTVYHHGVATVRHHMHPRVMALFQSQVVSPVWWPRVPITGELRTIGFPPAQRVGLGFHALNRHGTLQGPHTVFGSLLPFTFPAEAEARFAPSECGLHIQLTWQAPGSAEPAKTWGCAMCLLCHMTLIK